MKLKNILFIFIALIISFGIVFYQKGSAKTLNPIIAYRVYLEGKDIGLIKSQEEFENYINQQQEALKNKYNVDKVYVPNAIDIIKDVTYEENLDSVIEIYDKINTIAPFTIKGYEITIDKTNSSVYINDDNNEETAKIIKLYVLDKNIFVDAVKSVLLSFVSEGEYNAFINNEQLKIETTGQLIEDIFIEDEITIKEAYITVTNDIYTNVDDLTKYLIFGSSQNENDKVYVVKSGDTIEEIANSNKMSVNELLIANSSIRSEKSLLYAGQELSIGVLNPVFTTVVEKHVVTDQSVKFKTTYQYDNRKPIGWMKEIQSGVNGVTRVTQKVKTINGEISSAVIASSEEISPSIERIVQKGGRQVKRGDGEWVWPTNIPYIISSPYGWRWGKLHQGLDICGTGKGSPIYAARDGTITRLGWMSSGGWYVEIKHDNGYYSHYLHMLNDHGTSAYNANYNSSAAKYVKVGDYVKAGTVIGDMGDSGYAFGVHLHFGIWDGIPYAGGQSYNPLLFY